MSFHWRAKTILVTGGTGTFGEAFSRFLLESEEIAALRILSRDELKQWEMSRRLVDPRLRFLVGDVRDRDRLFRALDGVDVVVHAAAMKQVPACEYNPFEAVKTNVLGAQNVIDAAIERGVARIVALSTDKAAAPVNLYGATKLCAEKMFIQGNSYVGHRPSRFACVRYGNVVASRGSVVPLFMQQQAQGWIPITDRRMTRFWITVKQAISFVKRAVEEMNGGEIFVPKIPSVKIVDLAEAIAPGCPIRETGIRPGEKIHETLVTLEESRHSFDVVWSFLIAPEGTWSLEEHWRGQSAMTAEEVYSSDRNTEWLTREQILGALPLAMNEAAHYESDIPAPVSED